MRSIYTNIDELTKRVVPKMRGKEGATHTRLAGCDGGVAGRYTKMWHGRSPRIHIQFRVPRNPVAIRASRRFSHGQVRTFANFWVTRRNRGCELDNWPIDQFSLYDLIIGGGGVGTVQAKHFFEICLGNICPTCHSSNYQIIQAALVDRPIV